nr:tetratricopeptide repeat protein [bacterium]
TKGAIFIYEWYKRLGKDKFDLFMKKIFNKNNYSSLSVDNFLNELQSFIKSDSTQKINFKEIVDFYLNDTNVYISNDINKNPDSILFAIGETEFKKTINKNKMLNNLDKYFKDKNWKELLLISDNLLSLDLSNDEFGLVYFYKGLALSKTKNFIESKSLLLKSLEFLPASHWTSAWAHNTIGEILFNEKKYEEAENHFKKTIEINATNNSVKTAKYFLKQIHKNE